MGVRVFFSISLGGRKKRKGEGLNIDSLIRPRPSLDRKKKRGRKEGGGKKWGRDQRTHLT